MTEAEQVFFNAPLLFLEDAAHSQQEPRLHALGQTDESRAVLHVTWLLAKVLHVTIKKEVFMAIPVAARVQKRRSALRMAGLSPVQIWVPDTRQPGFAQECLRQSQIASQADTADADMHRLMDAALADVDGWTD